MKPLISHTGTALVLRHRNVDTDQIVPAEFCKRVTRTGYADALFARWRADPGFVLNQAAAADATVLVAGPDFGTGSSREHAVWALRDWGFVVVLSARFGDIFHRNALKNGLLAVTLDEPVVEELMAAGAAEITVDLQAREVRLDSRVWTFQIDERARWLLLNGYDDIDVTLRHSDEIADFEHGRNHWLPTVTRSTTGAMR